MDALGASFQPLSNNERRALGIRHGVKVTSVRTGKFRDVGIREGFVVTAVNKTPVNDVNDIEKILEETEGGVLIEGVDRRGSRSQFAFGL
jgi:S1-C subfamily serine protease